MPQGLTAFNVARIIVLLSEKLTQETTGTTISRYCASSLDAIRHAGNAIKAGEGDVYVAAGVEWVSKFNEATEAVRADDRNPNLLGKEEGQPNAYIEMGHTAVNVAKKYEVSRADMDKFAQRSQELAVGSQESGFFDREIVAVKDQDGNEVAKDDGPRASSTLEKLSELPEAFGEGGVTAGNSCPLNDGAAAVLVMSDTKAKELGLTPRARIVSTATWGNEPEYMRASRRSARSRRSSERTGMTMNDIGRRRAERGVRRPGDPDHVRVRHPDREAEHADGGAIALGHPFGMTGARIMTTLLNVMETDDHAVGLETMCVAGGQGEAMIVERV